MVKEEIDSSSLLEHPRRNLGNRYRAQANRFIKLAKKDPERAENSLEWAEQNARQAILHDFTDEENWRCLANIKKILADSAGLEQTLRDLFTVLGRNSDHLDQLNDIDHLEFGMELLDAVLKRDPLDASLWWSLISENNLEISINEFSSRCKKLDFRDQRANIIFARRIKILRDEGYEELFIELSNFLLAHRPNNHELWMDLGRLHERNNDMGNAWLCYDQVQTLLPRIEARDLFLQRLQSKMDNGEQIPWSGTPSIEDRTTFLKKMERLASKTISTLQDNPEVSKLEEITEDKDLSRLRTLFEEKNFQEAFFYARRLVAQGENWAEEWMQNAREQL